MKIWFVMKFFTSFVIRLHAKLRLEKRPIIGDKLDLGRSVAIQARPVKEKAWPSLACFHPY